MDKEYFDTNRLNDLSIMEVARRLGDTLKREGSVYKTRCPWHEDSHPSLTFYERTGESRCHCFACGNGGSVISYVMQHEKWTFQEACQWLSNGFGILTTKSGKTYIPKQRGRTPAPQPPKPEYTYIPNNMVDEMVSSDNSLCKCLKQMFSEDDVNRVVEALKQFNGDFVLQTMFLKSKDFDSSSPEVLEDWMDIVRLLKPREIMAYTIDRPTPEEGLQKFTVEEMKNFLNPLIEEGFNVQIKG